MSNDLSESLRSATAIIIQQRHEIAELIGFETRNKYVIETEQGSPVGFAAEQKKGILAALARHFLGHWRTFEVLFFDNRREVAMRAVHPFRFFFQRLDVSTPEGTAIGAIQQRFGILHKKFDVLDEVGQTLMTVRSPIWRIWTFEFQKQGRVAATISKKWSGLLAEAFTDKDKFRIEFSDGELSENERLLLLASGLFIDLQYFEKKARN